MGDETYLLEFNISIPHERIAPYLNGDYENRLRAYDEIEARIKKRYKTNLSGARAAKATRLKIETEIFRGNVLTAQGICVDDYLRTMESECFNNDASDKIHDASNEFFMRDVQRAARVFTNNVDDCHINFEKNQEALLEERATELRNVNNMRVLENSIRDTMLRQLEIRSPQICTELEAECGVCMEPVVAGSTVYGLACGHVFHQDCIKKWRIEKNTCPLCRAVLF
jgi:hypothetical protein